jgi:hypothetical protein
LSIDSSGFESREAASERGEEVAEGGIVIAPLYGVPGIGGAIGRFRWFGKLCCGLCQSERRWTEVFKRLREGCVQVMKGVYRV